MKRARRAMPFDPAQAHRWPMAIGVDEVGRGPLAGPVVTCAVWFEPAAIPPDLLGALDDSKRIAAARREALAARIMDVAAVALAAGSAARIDREGIRNVTLAAMGRAVRRLGRDGPVLVDGVDRIPGLVERCTPVVKGDATVPQIAAASIVAKVCRDRIMARLALRHPAYGWERNAGYGTADHLAGLSDHGPTRHHRLSFGRVGARGPESPV